MVSVSRLGKGEIPPLFENVASLTSRITLCWADFESEYLERIQRSEAFVSSSDRVLIAVNRSNISWNG